MTDTGTNAAAWALAIGLATLAVAVAWRLVRLWRLRRGIAAGLRDPDAGVREVAVTQAAEMGLATSAPAMLRAVRLEKDTRVLAAVVRTVAARQWEPASTGAIVELRLWARAYAERHPELRRAPTAPPLLAGVPGAVPPPSLDPSRAHEFRTRQDHVPEISGPDEWPDHTPPDDDALRPVRVLVTGAGGPAGVAVVRALRARGHYVVAVDASDEGVGLRLADAHHVVPRADDAHYLAALLRVATVTESQALVCTVAEEYRSLGRAQAYLNEAGLHTLMPSIGAVEQCIDKWLFYEALRDDALPVARTGLASAEGVPGPWIIKPRFGRGSRDVVAATTRTQLTAALRTVPDPIVQTQLSGREFTCDALVDRTGALVAASPRWRIETRGGISTKGRTFDDAVVAEVCGLALKSVGLIGPANVQGFVCENGAVVLHEINPRFSGGLPLTIAAGCDIVEEYLRDVMGLPVRPSRLVATPGVTMSRYFSEVYY